MERAKLIDLYLEKSNDPDFEIDQIRKDLESMGVEDEEIRVITFLVDNDMQRRLIRRNRMSKSRILFLCGVITIVLGVVLFMLTGGALIFLITTVSGGGLMAYGRPNR